MRLAFEEASQIVPHKQPWIVRAGAGHLLQLLQRQQQRRGQHDLQLGQAQLNCKKFDIVTRRPQVVSLFKL